MQELLERKVPAPAAAPAAASAPARRDRRSVRSREQLRDALAAEIQATGDLSRVTVTALGIPLIVWTFE